MPQPLDQGRHGIGVADDEDGVPRVLAAERGDQLFHVPVDSVAEGGQKGVGVQVRARVHAVAHCTRIVGARAGMRR